MQSRYLTVRSNFKTLVAWLLQNSNRKKYAQWQLMLLAVLNYCSFSSSHGMRSFPILLLNILAHFSNPSHPFHPPNLFSFMALLFVESKERQKDEEKFVFSIRRPRDYCQV